MSKDPLSRILVAGGLFGLCLCLGGANCADRALCEKVKECASDPPGEDYVEVCTQQRQGQMAALRANKEEDCQTYAQALAAYDACRAQLECDEFNEPDLDGECEDEREDLEDAYDDAADDRVGGTAIGRAGPGPNVGGIPLECSSWD